MALYVQLRNVFAIHIEWNIEFGYKPYLSIHNHRGETVIDIPCIRIILTPGKILKAERTNGLKEMVNTYDEKNR